MENSHKVLIVVAAAVLALFTCSVAALVGAALASGGAVSGTGSAQGEAQSHSYWVGTAPFAVTAWKYGGNTLSLTVQNMESEKLVLTGISISGTQVYSANNTFEAGESKVLSITLPSACGSTGSSFELGNVMFTYDKGGITSLIMKGDKPIAGKCS